MDPQCCAAAIMDVPFLDVLNDMLDPSLLLTIKERKEWGDPLNDPVRQFTSARCAPKSTGLLFYLHIIIALVGSVGLPLVSEDCIACSQAGYHSRTISRAYHTPILAPKLLLLPE